MLMWRLLNQKIKINNKVIKRELVGYKQVYIKTWNPNNMQLRSLIWIMSFHFSLCNFYFYLVRNLHRINIFKIIYRALYKKYTDTLLWQALVTLYYHYYLLSVQGKYRYSSQLRSAATVLLLSLSNIMLTKYNI